MRFNHNLSEMEWIESQRATGANDAQRHIFLISSNSLMRAKWNCVWIMTMIMTFDERLRELWEKLKYENFTQSFAK